MGITLVILSSLVALLFWKLHGIGRRPKDFPPGPPTIPILGNLHLIPQENVHLQFQKWAQEYGPVYSVMLGSKTIIILSSDEAIKEILDNRSGVSSDRMDLYMGQTLASGGLRVLLMRYGPSWRMIRRILHHRLNINAARSFEPYQTLESNQMLFDILNEPHMFTHHVRRYANSLTTATTFGFRVPVCDDPHFQELFKVFSEFVVLAQTGAAAVLDYIPALRVLPEWMIPSKRRARIHHLREKALYRYHWDRAKSNIINSTNPNPCFSLGLVEEQRKHAFDDDLASYITGTLLEAGSDTTSNTLVGFLCAMILFPDVQLRAQNELDRVVGKNRLPSFNDQKHLPYIRGCVKESLRWMPTTILGAVPHALTQDEYYMGFRLPKGAGLMNNVYTIHNDATRYKNPRQFDPERYINDQQSFFEAAINTDVSKRDHFTFGAGRRICPGIHVAEQNLFLAISRLLWAFEFRCYVDDDGNEVRPDPSKMTQGFVCAPLPFKSVITPRHARRATVICEEWDEAKKANLTPNTMQWKMCP